MSSNFFDLTPEVFRTLAENSVDSISIGNLEGKLIYSNRACYDLFGYAYEKEEMTGLPLVSFWPEEDIPILTEEVLPQAMAGNWLGEVRQKRKDGHLFDAYLTAFALLDEVGKSMGTVAITRDITERKRAVEALQESERHLRTTLDSLRIGVAIIDAETHVIADVNPVAIEMIDAPKEKILGHVCHKFICPAEERKCPITDLGQTVDRSERVLINANGERIPILKTVTPIMLSGRRRLLESFFDITERKRAEEERERLQREIIETQQQALRELSTPIVPVLKGVLVMPLVGSIDTERAQQVMETLLEAISHYQAAVVIIDITGVPMVDTRVANHLLQVTRAAALLGSGCMLVGISPEVAQTIVSLGVDLSAIATHSNLQSGIQYALSRMGKEISDKN